MPVFTSSNPVVVGQATKKTHYDKVFDNTLWLYDETIIRPKQIHRNTTAVAVSGASEQDLMSWSIPGGTLANDGEKLIVLARFTFAADTDSRLVKAVYGAVSFSTLSFSGNADIRFGEITLEVVRLGATSQDVYAWGTHRKRFGAAADNVLGYGEHAAGSETLGGAVTVKFRGDGDNADDIVQREMRVFWCPA
jgi:hypothetical protein